MERSKSLVRTTRFEIEQIQDLVKRKDVRGFERTPATVIVSTSDRLKSWQDRLPGDALHLSAACLGEAEFFLTWDDEIMERMGRIENLLAERGYRLKVRNPVTYLREKRRLKI